MSEFVQQLIAEVERAGFSSGVAFLDHRNAPSRGCDDQTVTALERVSKARDKYARALAAAAQAAYGNAVADRILADLNAQERCEKEA